MINIRNLDTISLSTILKITIALYKIHVVKTL